MKKILVIAFLIINVSLFAQDSIPTIDTSTIEIVIPKFSDPKVQNVAEEYISVIKESIIIRKNPALDDLAKSEEFSKRSVELGKKIYEVMQLLSSSPDEMKRFTDFMQTAAQTMAKQYAPSKETKSNTAPISEPLKSPSKKKTNKKSTSKNPSTNSH